MVEYAQIAYVYAYNCYSIHARLFVLGGAELKSKEGATQGDPTSIGSLCPRLTSTHLVSAQTESEVSQVAYADDLTGGGKVAGLREWFDAIADKGPLYGYHAEPTKSWLTAVYSLLRKGHYSIVSRNARRCLNQAFAPITMAKNDDVIFRKVYWVKNY